MTPDHTARRAELMGRLALPFGGFAMVALDQRESLRAYLNQAAGHRVGDAEITEFKRAAIEDLAPSASGVLVDIDYGYPAWVEAGVATNGTGLIIAADRLTQEAGGPITAVDLDHRVGRAAVQDSGCAALKLLVVWRPGGDPAGRRELVQQFIRRCRDLSVLALVEAVLDAETRERARAEAPSLWFEMHAEMLALHPDIYKTEIPATPGAPRELLLSRCREISAMAACPWVLLSSGVAPDSFPATITSACEAGASGFLAGRAIWRAAISRFGYDATNPQGAKARLSALVSVVQSLARPWHEVARRQ